MGSVPAAAAGRPRRARAGGPRPTLRAPSCSAPTAALIWAGPSPAAAARDRGGQDRGDPARRDAGPAGRPASSTRSARAKRGGEMSGKDWDSLSDVDYWAELASDKPLTTTAQAGLGWRF